MKEKFRERAGASIALALFYMLLCSVLATVIITASTVLAGSHASSSKNEQGYYLAISTFKLFQDEIAGKTVAYDKGDSTLDLEMKLAGNGIRLSKKILARGIINLKNADSGVKEVYSESFSLELEDYSCQIVGEFSINPADCELTFEIKEINLDEEKLTLPSVEKLVIGIDNIEEDEQYAKITYDYGRLR